MLEEKADKLESSIIHDEGVLSDKEYKLSNVRPGGREYEIRETLNDAIHSITDKIYSKKDKLDGIRRKISEVESQRWINFKKGGKKINNKIISLFFFFKVYLRYFFIIKTIFSL